MRFLFSLNGKVKYLAGITAFWGTRLHKAFNLTVNYPEINYEHAHMSQTMTKEG